MDFRSTRVWQWATVLVVALIVGLVTLGAVYLAGVNNDLRAELRAERADSRAATANAQESYEQLVAEGIKPEAEEPAKVDPPRDGEAGLDGRDGRSATTEQIAYSVSVYCSTRTDCEGTPGAPSTIPGADGTDGMNGQDSTVPGPVGPMGPASTIPGPKGDTGDAGSNGEPPMSWTFSTTPGGEQTCSRTEPFDPAAPTYACAPTPKEIP